MKYRRLLQILNHGLAAALLVIASGFWLGKPVWRAGKALILLTGLFAAAYLACAIFLALWRPKEGRASRLLAVLVAGTAAFGLAFMALAFAEWQWPQAFGGNLPRIVPFASFALGLAGLVALTWAYDQRAGRTQVFLTFLLVSLIAATHFAVRQNATVPRERVVSFLDTSLHVLKSTRYRKWLGDPDGRGGAIAAFDQGYLVASGGGRLYYANETGDEEMLAVRELSYRVPFNAEEFARAGREAFGEAWTDDLHSQRLRVADLQVQERPDGSFRMFVSHHVWRQRESCFAVRVSVLEGDKRELLDEAGALSWRTLYESTPCLKLNVDGHRGGRFGGYQIGGAMAFPGENRLLLAVGDHEYDGWNRTPALSQDTASPYGKLMLIRIDSGVAEVFSSGHRNPQGLFVDSSGTVWSTEHGPRGGDELNRVRHGANYGWPLVTYGTEYSLHHWPMSSSPGGHDGFEKPVAAFVPSIALSSVTGIDGRLFTSWHGDLLLTSLAGQLQRVRIDDGRAVVVEPFAVEGRIRDAAQGRDGKIALWSDAHDLVLLEPADTDVPGALVFQCVGCHTLNKWENASIGPNLWRVFGRKIGAEDDFEYSRALTEFGGRWTRKRLDQFLADPQRAVPGTTMQFAGVADAAQREQLVTYLEQLR